MNISAKLHSLTNGAEPINLHLGCGKKILPGFLHIDRDDYPHIDLVGPINELSVIPDECVDLIYCCHALEYFDLIEVPEVLKEWNRVLKPKGILRISVRRQRAFFA